MTREEALMVLISLVLLGVACFGVVCVIDAATDLEDRLEAFEGRS